MTRGYILTCTKIFLNTAVSCENFLLLITRIFFFGSLHLFIQFSYWKFIGVISVDLSIFFKLSNLFGSWPPVLWYSPWPWPQSPAIMFWSRLKHFWKFKADCLIYLFIIWNHFLIGNTLIIIYHDYYESLTKSKIKAHLPENWQAKNNLMYLFSAKNWSCIIKSLSEATVLV